MINDPDLRGIKIFYLPVVIPGLRKILVLS